MEDPAKEESYWREQHAKQPYADKNRSYEEYAPAYRIGAEAAVKHAGKEFEEIEDDIALDYAYTDNRPRMNELRGEPEKIFASRDEFTR